MKISCLCPTYNRGSGKMNLLQEAVECFRRQDYPDRELIIGNDTPGQTLRCSVPGVRVINYKHRFPTLTDKINAMIERAEGDLMCRWDDDDISLPHRLSYSVRRLASHPGKLEWRATNYWYTPTSGGYHYTNLPGNTHCMALWDFRILHRMEWGGFYPPQMSGWEDQEFNRAADATGYATPEQIPVEDIFYLYRWGSSPTHLSGGGGSGSVAENMQKFYDHIGTLPTTEGAFDITPWWAADYSQLANEAAASSEAVQAEPKIPWE